MHCWGLGLHGRNGDSREWDHGRPRPADGLAPGAKRLAAGSHHACVIDAEDRVACWGSSTNGQIPGSGPAREARVVPIPGMSGAPVEIHAGVFHTCVLSDAGEVWCWGVIGNGRLGDGRDEGGVSDPVRAAVTDARALAVGSDYGCAIVGDAGTVQCWGQNGRGQGAAPDTTPALLTPRDIDMQPGPAVSIWAAHGNTCLIDEAGAVYCWGENDEEQIDPSLGGVVREPTPVDGLAAGMVELAIGDQHLCARDGAGQVFCWGQTENGATGSDAAAARVGPTLVDLPEAATTVATGARHTCVAAPSGAHCFGADPLGQLGIGAEMVVDVPRRVDWSEVEAARGAPTRVAVGDGSSCALAGGEVVCWGDGANGRLGLGNNRDRSRPGPSVLEVGGPRLAGVSDIRMGDRHVCAWDGASFFCWGGLNFEAIGASGGLEANPEAFDVGLPATWRPPFDLGYRFSCFVVGGTDIGCVGQNQHRQAGRICGSPGDPCVDYPDTGLISIDGLERLTLGWYHACASAGSTIQCWGRNNFGQLTGDGPSTEIPVSFMADDTIVGIAAGATHTCLAEPAQVLCWGDNSYDQVDPGGGTVYSAPVPIRGVTRTTELEAGGAFTCALTDEDTVVCWGDDAFGQLGRAGAGDHTAGLVELPESESARQIAVGALHACAQVQGDSGDAIYCWGSDRHGQLGVGRPLRVRAPTPVLGPLAE